MALTVESYMKTICNQLRKRLPVLILVSALALAGTTLAFTKKSAEKVKTSPAAVNVPVDETSVQRDALPRGSFAPIVKKVTPGVVKIETITTISHTSSEQFQGFNDPFW